MTIQIDSREKARAIKMILATFDRMEVEYFVSKLPVGRLAPLLQTSRL